jgi:hypothetical protein
VRLDKDESEAIIASSIALNLIACAVLSEKPVMEAKGHVQQIVELYRQHLLDSGHLI